MRPLRDFPLAERREIRTVLTDIDDTLTLDGRLPGAAYQALERLREAGIIVVPVTGRPAGWCDMIARFWPVDGVVGENGAFYFRYDAEHRKMIRRYAKSADDRRRDRDRLATIEREVLRAVPGAATASDQAYREADLAIDFCEDVEPLSMADIDRIVGIFVRHGATAKISSIHVNGWFGSYDKLSMSRIFLREVFGQDMDGIRNSIVFAGDSPNDAPMFGFFPNAVGVANVLQFADRLPAQPAWITVNEGGMGFVELAEALIRAR
jgi:HAD superfamily hydrolase (TIGR01484 family)